MERRYASAGPNKQMFEMYNFGLRSNVALPVDMNATGYG